MAITVVATLAQTSSASALEGDYTIQSGDSLSKIAQQHETTWQDLHQKNTYIADPNLIYAGNSLVIKGEVAKPAEPTPPAPVVQEAPVPTGPPAPTPAPAVVCDEATQWVRADNGQCLDKPKPAPVAAPAPVHTPTPAPVAQAPARQQYNTAGNTYYAGRCTWHVKNLKPELPNMLGNADEWYWNAQRMGLATGTEPAVGAAATRKVGMHAVYVTAVNGDGTITVSEMNYNYVPYSVRTSIKNASDFYYIY